MKKLAIVSVLALAGYFGYQRMQTDRHPAVGVYASFVKALRTTRLNDAQQIAHGDQAADDLAAFRRREAQRYRERGSINIKRIRWTVDSIYEEGGVTVLELSEEIRCDPPGATSTIGSVNVWLAHTVEMKKVGGAWKVIAFSWEFADAEGIDGSNIDDVSRWF